MLSVYALNKSQLMSKPGEINIKNFWAYDLVRFFVHGLMTSACVLFLGYLINSTKLFQSFAVINFISGSCGIFINFSLNYRFNFFDREKFFKLNFAKFVVVSTCLIVAVIPMTSMVHMLLEDILLEIMSEDLMRITLHVLVLKMFFILSFSLHSRVSFGARKNL